MVRTSLIILFAVYLLILLKLIVFKHPTDFTVETSFFSLNSNFMPFKTILGYLSGEPSWQIVVRNLAGNLLLFVPFGVFLPLIFRTMRWKRVLITALVFSLLLETLQVFLPGSPDVDDVILNTLGGLLGYVAFTWCISMVKRDYASRP